MKTRNLMLQLRIYDRLFVFGYSYSHDCSVHDAISMRIGRWLQTDEKVAHFWSTVPYDGGIINCETDERIMFYWRFSCTVISTHFNTAVAISRYISASVSFSNCNVLRATGDAFDILASVCTNDDVIQIKSNQILYLNSIHIRHLPFCNMVEHA